MRTLLMTDKQVRGAYELTLEGFVDIEFLLENQNEQLVFVAKLNDKWYDVEMNKETFEYSMYAR